MHIFPYSTVDGVGYIFSALNNPCSLEDINNALKAEIISETYKAFLLENLYNAGQDPKAAYFASV